MSKQADIIRELQDRLNATEAICQDLLSHLYNSEAQGRIKFDDYRIKYTQEAIERREAEAKAKQLRDNFNTAKADFRDMAEANFWSLVFLSNEERQEKLDDIWSTITSGLVLPEDAKRPQHIVPELTVDQLINRRAELLDSINRANATQHKSTIEHCNQSKADFGLNMERERDKQIAEINRKDGVSESERQRQVSDTQAYFDREIKKHLLEMQRQISSAEVGLERLENHKAELAKVQQALAKQLTH
ncbi:hypothetical protein KUL156_40770 [Alteromonas sp. KUL156]|nr:hypothetical protein KUL154_20930 [Alteromonas sp. KUL154]GFE01485.1 hypothetical protein KUL156_40770 [Alteromonas sp. KUL156]